MKSVARSLMMMEMVMMLLLFLSGETQEVSESFSALSFLLV